MLYNGFMQPLKRDLGGRIQHGSSELISLVPPQKEEEICTVLRTFPDSLEQTFHTNDWVTVGDNYGRVTEIVRHVCSHDLVIVSRLSTFWGWLPLMSWHPRQVHIDKDPMAAQFGSA